MQSGLRFFLAWLVVIAHLTQGVVGWTQHLGVFAVFGFYLLSGFLITLVLNETYKSSSVAFFKNRILRLYPIYYVILVFTFAVVLFLPGAVEYKSTWKFQTNPEDIIGNLLIFPFEFYNSDFRLIPPSWSVGVELINYFILWLIIARHKLIAFGSVFLSVFYHINIYLADPDWMLRYAPFEAALLPFSIGASIYFIKDKASKVSIGTINNILIVSFLLWIGNMLYCGIMGAQKFTFFNTSFYTNMILIGVIMWANNHPAYSKRATGLLKLLGDLSYPVFLIHWQVGFLTYTTLNLDQTRGWLMLVLSIPPILFFSWLSLKATAPFIEPVRDKIRNQ